MIIIIMHRGPPIQGRSYIVQEQSVNKSNIWPSRGSLCIRRAAGQRLRGCTGPTKGCDGMFSLAQGCIKLSLFHQVTGCLSVDLNLVGPCYEARVLARRVRLRKQQPQQRIQQLYSPWSYQGFVESLFPHLGPEHVMQIYGAFVVAGRSYRSGPQNMPDAIVVTL